MSENACGRAAANPLGRPEAVPGMPPHTPLAKWAICPSSRPFGQRSLVIPSTKVCVK